MHNKHCLDAQVYYSSMSQDSPDALVTPSHEK